MRRRGTTLVLAAAAAALLSGCTSEVSGSASPASASSSGSGSGGLSDEERHDMFCADVPVLLQDITADLEQVSTDPAAALEALEDAVDRMMEIQPPDDAADEWERLVAVWQDLADLLARVDPGDPAGAEELADELLGLQSELVDAGTAVDEWGQENC